MQTQMTIKSWALNDQPIHKLYTKGAKYLTDAELIAILLQQGTAQNNANAITICYNCQNFLPRIYLH